MNNYTVNNERGAGKADMLKQMMNVEDIRFNRIYINAVPLEDDVVVYGYVRDWKNGKVGYSVIDEATDDPDFSNCGVFWMAPEDFAKVFTVFRDMSDAGSGAETRDGIRADACSISEFREIVKKAVIEAIPRDKREVLTIDNTEVVKINDQKLYGIVFHSEGTSSRPTFYLNESYEHYIHGMPLKNIVKQLADSFLFYAAGVDPEMETAFVKDEDSGFDDIRDRLAVKVLEKERNREFLENYPHKEIDCGFAMVFDVQTVIRGNDVWRMPVTYDVLNKAGLDEGDLYDAAMDHISEVDPAVLMSLERKQSGKKIKNLFENDKRISNNQKTMYLLTNRCGKYGAATFFYPGMQKRIADRIDDNYYAIPSSLHEFIIVPESSGADIARLCDKLKNDNWSTAHQEDVFSDRVFHYDRKWDQLICVNDMIGEKGTEC